MAIALTHGQSRFRTSILTMMKVALGLGTFVAAALASQERKANELEVQVLCEGKPAEGATVWMEKLAPQHDETWAGKKVGPYAAAASGLVRISLPVGERKFVVFAKDDQGQCGQGTFILPPIGNIQKVTRLVLTLQKMKSVQGQLFFENKPLADVDCKLDSARYQIKLGEINQSGGTVFGTHLSTPIGALPITCKTDRQGRFSFPGIPENHLALVSIAKEGLGTGMVSATPEKPVEVDLEPGGNVAVSIEGEAGPVVIKKVELRQDSPSKRKVPQGRQIAQMIPGKPIEGPDFTVPGVGGHYRGTYLASIPFDPTLPYYFGPPQEVKIEPGKTCALILKKIPVAQCSGLIVDPLTGKGFPRLAIQLAGTANWKEGVAASEQEFTEFFFGSTDANGKYAIPCKGNLVYTLLFGRTSNNRTHFQFSYWDGIGKGFRPAVPHLGIAVGEPAQFPDVALTRRPVATRRAKGG